MAVKPIPATISAIPRGNRPTIHNITPIATIDTPIIAPKSLKNLATAVLTVPQFKAIPATVEAIPTCINPRPRGNRPTIHNITPIASNDTPIIAPISLKNLATAPMITP